MRLASILLLLFTGVHASAQNASPTQTLDQSRRLANTGRGEEALHLLESLSTATQGLQAVRGLAFYDMDRLPEADKAFAEALQADPHDAAAAQMRGLTLFRLGRPAEAIPLLESAMSVDAQTKSAPTYVLALCYVDTRRYEDARRAYAAQYALAPDSAAAYLLAARMLLRREYLPIAERFAQRAGELDPHLPLVHEVLGEIALAGNRLDEAAAFFNQELKLNPMDAASYERLGDLLGRQGKFAESRQALQRAVLLEPNSTGPYILLGRTTLREGDAVAALTYLQRAGRMDPANVMTHNLLAQAYRTLNRPADATRELGIVEKLHAADEPKLSPAQ